MQQRRHHKPVFNPSVVEQHLSTTEKSQEHVDLIFRALETLLLTKDLPRSVHEKLSAVVQPMNFHKGDVVIKEGDSGDRFFIIVQGHLDVTRSGKKVNECKPGTGFGDLALLLNQPRAATVTATEDSFCYYLTSEHFKVFLMQVRKAQIEKYKVLIRNIKALSSLNEQETYMIAQAMKPYNVLENTNIITQGEQGDLFYYIEKGDVEIIYNGKKVNELHSGSYFGEAALLHSALRNATVKSMGPCELAVVDRETFINLIGNVGARLEEGRKND
ncbi:cAMP-dependent_protein kinase regulatory chain [Hexamita inflata]|uniref:cAMP-dependent protein kinase regulatory chain n=1 Tax=Hexamita inflata TaxID=28002 RepID=A0AA86Q4R5_9EUKA|nr:cAMP-dependent protein kinase regulatory chain [Hexamita inflata]CAI9967877.1 cAMP-dependent protein kinase regulatory chain [Hexamita inflata]